MDYTSILQQLRNQKLAARRYEKEGHGKFRDCITLCRNGRVKFQRFCYGEAASLVCTLWGAVPEEGDNIQWDYDRCDYSGKTEAPVALTGGEEGKLQFDGKRLLWAPEEDLKTMPEAGLGWLSMLFSK